MLTDGDLACPTCGSARETGGVAAEPAAGAPAKGRGNGQSVPRPISELLDLSTVPTTNGNGSVSAWDDTTADEVEEAETWDGADGDAAPWNGQVEAAKTGMWTPDDIAPAPTATWTPPTNAAPAPAPTWTPPPASVERPRPLSFQEPPPRFTPAPVPQPRRASVPARPDAASTSDDDVEAERFALLGGLDPRKLGAVSRRTWLALGVVAVAILVTVAIVFGLEQWQRALNAEHELDATRSRVTTQTQTIEGLSGRVLNLNSEIDKTSDLLSRAQDQAAVSGKDLDALSTAIGELAQARELMRAAVLNITKMTQALELKEFKEAGKFAEAASSQLEEAFVHEQRASQALN